MTEGADRRTVLRGTLMGAMAAGAVTVASPDTASAVPGGSGDGPEFGILLYEGFSTLDPTGPAEVLSRLPGARVTMVAARRGPVRADTGDVALVADRSIAEVDRFDALVVPGGGAHGTMAAIENRELVEWVGQVHRRTQWTTSVCTGALILGAAGVLEGRRATTHWASKDHLGDYGATYVAERYVRSGRVLTAAGVSAGVDMALWLAGAMAGESVAKAAQLAVEYAPRPPFDAGAPDKVGPKTRRLALRLLRDSQRRP